MSKHNKPYHNYNNYSGNKPEVKVEEPVVETAETTPVAEEVEQVEVTEEITENEPTVEVEESTIVEPAPAPTIGVVNCPRLRVRSEADSTADNVICEIEEGNEVQINEAESTADFYKIVTTAGAEGFCMKKFITIK